MMAEHTNIEWTHHTFNPWMGCLKVSDGCGNCYAEADAKRYGYDVWGPAATKRRHLTGPRTWREPLQWDQDARSAGVRARVFCGSMCDVFEDHPDVVNARERLWELISETTNLDWLLLTKRPENIIRMIPTEWTLPGEWPSFVWIGTSVENQQAADERLPHLLAVPAVMRFLSCEPLLGPVDLRPWLDRLQWIIVGGESGPKHSPMDLSWMREIAEACQTAGVPRFTKQDSGRYPGRQGRIPGDLWLHEYPTMEMAARERQGQMKAEDRR
jgi:protein gp37